MSEDSDDAATMVPAEPRAGLLSRLGGLGLQRVGGLLAAVLIAGFIFAVWSDWLFLKTGNLVVMIRLMGVLGIIGLGLLVVLLVGEIDLSFSALAVLSAIGVGLFNAFFVNVVKVPSFIVTLGSNTLVFGFTLLISRNTPILAQKLPPDPEEWQVRGGDYVDAAEYTFFRALASNYALPGRFPLQVVWLAGFAIVFGILLSRGVFGFRMKAIGGNEQAAVLAKLPVRRYKTLAFVICAVMAAVGGLLDFSFISQVQPNQGGVYLFPVFTAVIVGGASLSGGRGTVSGTLLGALLLAVISNGLALNATGAFVQQMWLGTVTIGAVVLDQWTRSRQRSESLGAGLRDLARRLGVLR
ncbi:MAG: ABC transporter permease [bacterium]|nr:ABC transporter permease [bacterium]